LRSFACDFETRASEFRVREICIGLRALVLQAALLTARELLHHADLAHGHEVARGGVRIRTVHRQIIDADDERRIGQTSGTHRQRAGSIKSRTLRSDLRRTLKRLLYRSVERKRLLVGTGRQRTDKKKQHAAMPTHLKLHRIPETTDGAVKRPCAAAASSPLPQGEVARSCARVRVGQMPQDVSQSSRFLECMKHTPADSAASKRSGRSKARRTISVELI
jgi:hypothetical protein